MQGPQGHYASPRVLDYGDLREITESLYPLMGVADLGFSSPDQSPNGGGGVGGGPSGPAPGPEASGVTQTPDAALGPVSNGGAPGTTVADGGGSADAGDVGGEGDSGGGDGGGDGGGGSGGGGSGGGGAGSGGGGGGGELPFTGLAAGVVAAVGSAVAAGGAALRRVARRRT